LALRRSSSTNNAQGCLDLQRAGAMMQAEQERRAMAEWDFQIRIDLADELAEMARRDPGSPALRPLADVLARHRASMQCQLDAFADYVAEAERQGAKGYPLYAWTRATIENPAKRAKYLKSFTVYVDGKAVYAKQLADALEAALKPLVDGKVITRLAKHDTNPANNPQVPPQYRER
jgi:hypothetical protein